MLDVDRTGFIHSTIWQLSLIPGTGTRDINMIVVFVVAAMAV